MNDFGTWKGHGTTLPSWMDETHPEARRGAARLQRIDPALHVAWDRKRQVFSILGPSKGRAGLVVLCDCQDDQGTHYRGAVPWEAVAQAIWNARHSVELACDRAARKNAELIASREAVHSQQTSDALRFYRPAIQGEMRGYGRHSASDVTDAYFRQTHSQKPAPVGQKIYVPASAEKEKH